MFPFAKILLTIGIGFILLAGIVYLFGRTGVSLGRLPGDIRIERDNFSCIFPLVSSILISILLTLLLNLAARFLNK